MEATLDALGLVVDDMARSLAFYRELGLDLPAEADAQPHVEHVLPGGLRILWDTVDVVRSFDPDWQPPTGGGHRLGIAFRCDDPAAVDAVHDKLVGLGHISYKAPWDAVWGQRYAVVLDPDGNSIDLFADSPQG